MQEKTREDQEIIIEEEAFFPEYKFSKEKKEVKLPQYKMFIAGIGYFYTDNVEVARWATAILAKEGHTDGHVWDTEKNEKVVQFSMNGVPILDKKSG